MATPEQIQAIGGGKSFHISPKSNLGYYGMKNRMLVRSAANLKGDVSQ